VSTTLTLFSLKTRGPRGSAGRNIWYGYEPSEVSAATAARFSASDFINIP
jgi:hypothetical protein